MPQMCASIKHFSALIGKLIDLRELRMPDINSIYLQWMKDPDVIQYLESRFDSYSREDLERYVKEKIEDPDNYLFAIIKKKTTRHIGNIKLGPINWNHRRASIGIMIGAKTLFGGGYGTEAVGLLVDFAFNELKLHKLTSGCYAPHRSAAIIFTKNGFTKEGTRRSHSILGGNYVDTFEFGIINPNELIDN